MFRDELSELVETALREGVSISTVLAALEAEAQYLEADGAAANQGGLGMYIVNAPERFRGQVVANGQCVRYCQVACPDLPHTRHWRQGARVRGSKIQHGAVIATFGTNARYENRTDGASHAAIFIAEHGDGLRVWDQWTGHPVAERTIRFRGGQGKSVNDGDQFYVVEGPQTVAVAA
jgi:hypothetical protein